MIEQIDKNDCVGCKACALICPVHAIEFKIDREGFEYPKVEEEKCIQCKKCLEVCPTKGQKESNTNAGKMYAARNQDEEVLMKSSSGGVFYALAKDMINLSGVVYGVILDEKNDVVYERAEYIEQVQQMCSSKYVDAYVSLHVIENLIEDVEQKRYILFTGTSCQIAGMKKLCESLKINLEKVIWMDFFVCSGKVSPLLWKKERQHLTVGRNAKAVSFRDKVHGWENFSFTIETEFGKCTKDFLVSRWSKFLDNPLCSRKSCITCGYDCGKCGSDLSVGDYWYNQSMVPKEWCDNKGISIVKINTQKGASAFENAADILRKEIIRVERPDKHNKKLEMKKREVFWDSFYENEYEVFCDTYAHIGIKERILLGIVRPFLIKTRLIRYFRK